MIEAMARATLWITVTAALTLAACGSTETKEAETASAAGPKLYVFDCGSIDGVGTDAFGLKPEEVATEGFATPCYLIVHPQGTLMWDVGQIPDADFPADGSPATAGVYTSTKPLLPQLAAVGYTPEQITYLALSHYHGDHTANANSFAGSTWLVQRADHEAMFNGSTDQYSDSAQYAKLKDAKTQILDGDYDVFNDGTVVLISTPGHTPGHQSLYLKLEHTGPIVLSGDLYHYPEERTLNRIPTIDFSQDETRASRERMETFLQTHTAKLWIQHDRAANATLKKAPEFYD